ncbi:MAG: hypothetical protein WAU91_20400 [Desulfatitalea sp.]
MPWQRFVIFTLAEPTSTTKSSDLPLIDASNPRCSGLARRWRTVPNHQEKGEVMKGLFRSVLWTGLALILSACLSDFSPRQKVVCLKQGQQQVFAAASNDPRVRLDWYLDGEKVAENQGTFTYAAEGLAGDRPAIHTLAVLALRGGVGGWPPQITGGMKWKVIVQRRAWRSEEMIDADSGSDHNPQVAMDADGGAMAIWQRAENRIWASRYVKASWGAAEPISPEWALPSPPFPPPPWLWLTDPKIAMDPTGKAIAIWLLAREDSESPVTIVWANRFDGAAWGTAKLFETEFTGDAFHPQIAMDAKGRAFAVWQQEAWDNPWGMYHEINIWAVRFDETDWGPIELLQNHFEVDEAAMNPQIAMGSADNALVVWKQFEGFYSGEYTWTFIAANRFDGSSWGTAEAIETRDQPLWSWSPQLAMDAKGNALAVWLVGDNTGNRSIWQNRFVDGDWGQAELIADGPADSLELAMNGEGKAVIVWIQDDAVWASRFDGLSWGAAVKISGDPSPASSPRIAMDTAGNAIAVWLKADGSDAGEVWASRLDGAAWEEAQRIGTAPATSVQLAMSANGSAIAVWESEGVIWANRFE